MNLRLFDTAGIAVKVCQPTRGWADERGDWLRFRLVLSEAVLVLVIVLGAIASRRFCDPRSEDVEPIVAVTRSGRGLRQAITSTLCESGKTSGLEVLAVSGMLIAATPWYVRYEERSQPSLRPTSDGSPHWQSDRPKDKPSYSLGDGGLNNSGSPPPQN